MRHRMALIESKVGDLRERWRGTGWDLRPGGMTYVDDRTAGWRHSLIGLMRWFSLSGSEVADDKADSGGA